MANNQDEIVVESAIHEEILHPNMIEDEDNRLVRRLSTLSRSQLILYKQRKRSCRYYFERFDLMIMKPLFIYKYKPETVKKNDEFFESF